MKQERAMELLNVLIDNMIEDEGDYANRAFDKLVGLGFSEAELFFDFNFC